MKNNLRNDYHIILDKNNTKPCLYNMIQILYIHVNREHRMKINIPNICQYWTWVFSVLYFCFSRFAPHFPSAAGIIFLSIFLTFENFKWRPEWDIPGLPQPSSRGSQCRALCLLQRWALWGLPDIQHLVPSAQTWATGRRASGCWVRAELVATLWHRCGQWSSCRGWGHFYTTGISSIWAGTGPCFQDA